MPYKKQSGGFVIPCVRRCVLTVVTATAVTVGSQALAAMADSASSFSVASTIAVPGATLKPGQYTIQILDHLSDRSIVQIDSVAGSTHVTFLGVNSSSNSNESAHAIEWPGKAKGRHALRGYLFTGGRQVEFVYPKAEAVALAQANGAGVVAIDPASEGRPELSKLTTTDMQMVNLWMLTPVRVGPDSSSQKGIEAKRYQPTIVAAATPATQPVARPAGVLTDAPRRPSQPTIARNEGGSPPVVRHARPVVSRLPKTGSELPLLWLGGLISITGAGLLRLRGRAQRLCA